MTKSTVDQIRERFDNSVERFSNLESGNVADSLAFAQALAALKLTYAGDLAWCTRQDVEALIANAASGWR